MLNGLSGKRNVTENVYVVLPGLLEKEIMMTNIFVNKWTILLNYLFSADTSFSALLLGPSLAQVSNA
jgi:hypothetical protein